jgi:hypothetical protein
MRQEDIDERLIEWELAHQRGESIDPPSLLAEAGPWQHYLKERLEVLRQTAWMLDDPVPTPLDPHLSQMVSRTIATVRDSHAITNTPSAEGIAAEPPGPAHNGLPAGQDLHGTPKNSVVDPGRASLHGMPQVAGFKCLGELGKGGFGIVYRALDEKLQRHVAIKFPLIHGKRERQKYVAEARNASRADVPGIVPIYYVGETHEGTPYVIQKLIEGRSLREILKLGGCLSPTQVVELFVGICQAAASAHAQSLVHRDLKPENVLVDHQGRPWITDFGLSIAEDDPDLPLASVAGTPNFMSPEQITGKVEWLDGRCDIWALGVMLYQCLTGRLPFHSTNTLDLHERILSYEPRPISQRQPNLRGNWDKIFRKCCAKSISDRYSSALQMADDLQQLGRSLEASTEKPNAILAELQGSYASFSRKPPQPTGFGAWPMRRLSPIAALALGLLTLVAFVGAFALWRPSGLVDELVVSSTGSGTHRTIQAALAAAHEDTNIFIEPGLYRESLVIGRKAILRGRGPRDSIKIVGADGPAFTVNSGGQLALYDLSIAVDDSTEGVWNAIDVPGGAVLLESCTVSAHEYDCLHLQSESSLIANACDFKNAKHPAIFAQLAQELLVRECRFQIGSDNVAETKFLAGMQIIQSGGTVSDCTFTGSSAVGIEWSDTHQTVTIDDCQFQNLERAVIATSCREFRIGGHGRALFENCGTAIELTGCGGGIQNCHIDAQQRAQGRGLLVRGLFNPDEPLAIEACHIRGARSPLVLGQSEAVATGLTIDGSDDMGVRLLDNSMLKLNSSQIRNCEVVGLLLEGSRAALQRCVLSNNKGTGIVVDGLEEALSCKSCLIEDNEVGLILLSGEARLEHTNIRRVTTGVLLARRHRLAFAATCDWQLSLEALGGTIEARQNAIHFLSPGSYRLLDCATSDPQDRPVLDLKLERVTHGENGHGAFTRAYRRTGTDTIGWKTRTIPSCT